MFQYLFFISHLAGLLLSDRLNQDRRRCPRCLRRITFVLTRWGVIQGQGLGRTLQAILLAFFSYNDDNIDGQTLFCPDKNSNVATLFTLTLHTGSSRDGFRAPFSLC